MSDKSSRVPSKRSREALDSMDDQKEPTPPRTPLRAGVESALFASRIEARYIDESSTSSQETNPSTSTEASEDRHASGADPSRPHAASSKGGPTRSPGTARKEDAQEKPRPSEASPGVETGARPKVRQAAGSSAGPQEGVASATEEVRDDRQALRALLALVVGSLPENGGDMPGFETRRLQDGNVLYILKGMKPDGSTDVQGPPRLLYAGSCIPRRKTDQGCGPTPATSDDTKARFVAPEIVYHPVYLETDGNGETANEDPANLPSTSGVRRAGRSVSPLKGITLSTTSSKAVASRDQMLRSLRISDEGSDTQTSQSSGEAQASRSEDNPDSNDGSSFEHILAVKLRGPEESSIFRRRASDPRSPLFGLNLGAQGRESSPPTGQRSRSPNAPRVVEVPRAPPSAAASQRTGASLDSERVFVYLPKKVRFTPPVSPSEEMPTNPTDSTSPIGYASRFASMITRRYHELREGISMTMDNMKTFMRDVESYMMFRAGHPRSNAEKYVFMFGLNTWLVIRNDRTMDYWFYSASSEPDLEGFFETEGSMPLTETSSSTGTLPRSRSTDTSSTSSSGLAACQDIMNRIGIMARTLPRKPHEPRREFTVDYLILEEVEDTDPGNSGAGSEAQEAAGGSREDPVARRESSGDPGAEGGSTEDPGAGEGGSLRDSGSGERGSKKDPGAGEGGSLRDSGSGKRGSKKDSGAGEGARRRDSSGASGGSERVI